MVIRPSHRTRSPHRIHSTPRWISPYLRKIMQVSIFRAQVLLTLSCKPDSERIHGSLARKLVVQPEADRLEYNWALSMNLTGRVATIEGPESREMKRDAPQSSRAPKSQKSKLRICLCP